MVGERWKGRTGCRVGADGFQRERNVTSATPPPPPMTEDMDMTDSRYVVEVIGWERGPMWWCDGVGCTNKVTPMHPLPNVLFCGGIQRSRDRDWMPNGITSEKGVCDENPPPIPSKMLASLVSIGTSKCFPPPFPPPFLHVAFFSLVRMSHVLGYIFYPISDGRGRQMRYWIKLTGLFSCARAPQEHL